MRRLAGVVLALALAAAPARAQETLPYEADLTGVENDLEKRIADASRLLADQDRPPPGLPTLQGRADRDREAIAEVLRSEGYYEGRVDIEIDAASHPARVRIRVDPGPAFVLAAYDIAFAVPHGQPPPEKPAHDAIGIDIGGRARAEPVAKADQAVIKALAEQGYPLAKIADRRVVVDHAARTMRVDLAVDTGPLARFGPLTVTGLSAIDQAWVVDRVPWRNGERFSLAALDRFRKRLADSRLFASVRLSTADALDADGLLPITVAVTEGKPRSVGFGASWSTTERLGGQAFWEDRNLLGGAERLRAQLTASQIRNAFDVTYDGPDVGMPDQDLIAALKAEDQDTRAYHTRTLGGSGGLSWQLGENWHASASGAVERTFETLEGVDRFFTLASAPLELRHDSSDDVLDPTGGDRLILSAQPFFSLLHDQTQFNRFEIYDTRYLKMLDRPRTVLAGWVRFGTIQGAGGADVPAAHRFYVGGAGSVRAFGYQKAGPIDAAGNPVGGGSSLAFGGEVRVKVTDTVGLVPFIEAGRGYAGAMPDPALPVFWGGGLGLRYFTTIGPVRADVAIPANPRSGIDDRWQIYLSLGQAF